MKGKISVKRVQKLSDLLDKYGMTLLAASGDIVPTPPWEHQLFAISDGNYLATGTSFLTFKEAEEWAKGWKKTCDKDEADSRAAIARAIRQTEARA